MKKPERYSLISEREFQKQVIQLAKLYKWRVHAERPARTKDGWRTPIQGDPGWPDLVLARKGKVIFAELKSENGNLSTEQFAWANELKIMKVWRPSDIDKIEAELR